MRGPGPSSSKRDEGGGFMRRSYTSTRRGHRGRWYETSEAAAALSRSRLALCALRLAIASRSSAQRERTVIFAASRYSQHRVGFDLDLRAIFEQCHDLHERHGGEVLADVL